jgi:glycosyltransferase involved in cell wall biosynthesis
MKVTISVRGRFHAFDLAEHLQESGHLHRLITSYPAFEAVKYGLARDRLATLPVHEVIRRLWDRMPGPVRRRQRLAFFLEQLFDRQAARRIPPDSDLLVGWSSFSGHAIRRAKSAGINTVVVRGSTHIAFQREILAEEYARWGLTPPPFPVQSVAREEAEYAAADFIDTQTDFVRRTFTDRGVAAAKIFVNPTGVRAEWFTPTAKADDVFRVIFCGTASIRKGTPDLLRAFAELDLPRAELWLIGPISDEIRPFLRRFERPSIRTLGPFREWELHKYYSQGSMFCIPSIEEGLAMVQPQAMACGLPLVCTTHAGGGVYMTTGREGFVIPIRDVDAIKEKILFFHDNPEAVVEMGRAARAAILAGFTWGHYGARMIEIYRRILAGEGVVP